MRKKGYSILPESEGARLNQERTLKAAEEAICGLLPELDLDQAGCYEAPAVRSDDPVLRKRLEQMNRFAFMSVTYTFEAAERSWTEKRSASGFPMMKMISQ